MRRTELHEVLEAGDSERMARAQRGNCDRVRAPVATFRIIDLVRALAHEREVVQRRREIRMRGTERGFLYRSGLTQQLLGGAVPAGSGGLLRGLDDWAGIRTIRHLSLRRTLAYSPLDAKADAAREPLSDGTYARASREIQREEMS